VVERVKYDQLTPEHQRIVCDKLDRLTAEQSAASQHEAPPPIGNEA
jgi:hypothetical protein